MTASADPESLLELKSPALPQRHWSTSFRKGSHTVTFRWLLATIRVPYWGHKTAPFLRTNHFCSSSNEQLSLTKRRGSTQCGTLNKSFGYLAATRGSFLCLKQTFPFSLPLKENRGAEKGFLRMRWGACPLEKVQFAGSGYTNELQEHVR